MKTEFTADWKEWITTNVSAGRDLDGIFKILLDEGYAFDSIAQEMDYKPSRPISELKNPFDVAAAEKARAAKQNGKSTFSRSTSKSCAAVL